MAGCITVIGKMFGNVNLATVFMRKLKRFEEATV